LLERIRACNDAAEVMSAARPFRVGGRDLGVILPRAALELSRYPEVFHVSEEVVTLVAGGDSAEARSEAVAEVLRELRASGRVPMLRGWRDEGWPVKPSFDAPAELVIERAAGPLFGVCGYGCHINGLVATQGHEPSHLWVARRSKSKQTYPGKLDHIVAGGLAHGELPRENVIRECAEEAGINAELAAKVRPAGLISCGSIDETGWGVKPDVIFCYDLALPVGFTPVVNDGEVESFELWDLQRVIDSLASDTQEWKPNVALVIIDMLVRRGFLPPEEAGYVEIVRSLRA